MKRLIAAALVLMAGMASVAATQNWLATIERTPVSHIVGNPDAPVTLTEYLSYTCPHCRDFTMTGEQALKLGYVQSGEVRYEYRHAIANPADLAATMLARCGDADKFPGNHAALMAAQPQINVLRQMATKSQTDRWNFGDKSARRRAVASDLGLYGVFERRGYTRVELDQCLNDQDLADRLEASADVDWSKISGTPAFAIDGTVLEDVHTWDGLSAALSGKAPAAQEQ
ncbi:thioredoxin domain-containing protein [Citromicrobium bathyomarinum]|uniref:thioredoxin domain-containing protein n=1 Tax=Citromicrobium bathyomarinum TaxID=72174 RepID=UPI00315AE977